MGSDPQAPSSYLERLGLKVDEYIGKSDREKYRLIRQRFFALTETNHVFSLAPRHRAKQKSLSQAYQGLLLGNEYYQEIKKLGLLLNPEYISKPPLPLRIQQQIIQQAYAIEDAIEGLDDAEKNGYWQQYCYYILLAKALDFHYWITFTRGAQQFISNASFESLTTLYWQRLQRFLIATFCREDINDFDILTIYTNQTSQAYADPYKLYNPIKISAAILFGVANSVTSLAQWLMYGVLSQTLSYLRHVDISKDEWMLIGLLGLTLFVLTAEFILPVLTCLYYTLVLAIGIERHALYLANPINKLFRPVTNVFYNLSNSAQIGLAVTLGVGVLALIFGCLYTPWLWGFLCSNGLDLMASFMVLLIPFISMVQNLNQLYPGLGHFAAVLGLGMMVLSPGLFFFSVEVFAGASSYAAASLSVFAVFLVLEALVPYMANCVYEGVRDYPLPVEPLSDSLKETISAVHTPMFYTQQYFSVSPESQPESLVIGETTIPLGP